MIKRNGFDNRKSVQSEMEREKNENKRELNDLNASKVFMTRLFLLHETVSALSEMVIIASSVLAMVSQICPI